MGLNIEIGGKYKTRNGQVVTITDYDTHCAPHVWGGLIDGEDTIRRWSNLGEWVYGPTGRDLVMRIEDADAPLKLAPGFWRTQNGTKVELVGRRQGNVPFPWIGCYFLRNGERSVGLLATWSEVGKYTANTPNDSHDIVGPWVDPIVERYVVLTNKGAQIVEQAPGPDCPELVASWKVRISKDGIEVLA